MLLMRVYSLLPGRSKKRKSPPSYEQDRLLRRVWRFLLQRVDVIDEFLVHQSCHPERREGSLREILRYAQNDIAGRSHLKVYERHDLA